MRETKKKKSNSKKIIIITLLLISIFCCVRLVLETTHTNREKIAEQRKRAQIVKKISDSGMMEEEIVSNENCEYTIEENGNVTLGYYDGSKESIVIPLEIDGKTIEKIDTTAFEDNVNLEVIKVPQKIAKNTEQLKDFEVNEKLSNDNYIVYTTIQEYNEEYLKYIELNEEEKQKVEALPSKFAVSIDKIYTPEMKELYSNLGTGINSSLPKKI